MKEALRFQITVAVAIEEAVVLREGECSRRGIRRIAKVRGDDALSLPTGLLDQDLHYTSNQHDHLPNMPNWANNSQCLSQPTPLPCVQARPRSGKVMHRSKPPPPTSAVQGGGCTITECQSQSHPLHHHRHTCSPSEYLTFGAGLGTSHTVQQFSPPTPPRSVVSPTRFRWLS